MFSRFFIERPIFAAVVSILLCLAGLVAMRALPIEQYPTIAPVQISITTAYPGADTKTVADAVAAPIEAQLNGVDNLLYTSSASSSNGQLTITAYFDLKVNPDIAQVQVQNRVNLALPQLPAAVTQYGVAVNKKSSSIMMLIGVVNADKRYTPEYTANYANVYVLDAIKRVPGAGQAAVLGSADQAMRVWMNPQRMASLGITTSDIQQAVSNQNALHGAGQVGQQPSANPLELTFPIVTQGPFSNPADYGEIIVKTSSDGASVVRLKDVARIESGLNQYIVQSKLNGAPATFLAVYQQAGANGLDVSDRVRAALAEMKPQFPPGIDYVVSLDTTDFVRVSIHEVVITLIEALVLVVLIVYLFLQSWRATIICGVAIVIALVATFTGMLAMGFSINLLTLFGLVLAIGMVVDDAIVVVENVERVMAERHLAPKAAAIAAMREVGSSLVAVVLVLSAVFIPAAFLSGTTGQLYRQFALTIVVSVSVSGFVALTLTPAMCALMLKHSAPKTTGFFGWFNRGIDRITAWFGAGLHWVVRRLLLAMCLLALMLGGGAWLFHKIPTSFVPQEDQGYVFAMVNMPDAASIDRTKATSERIDAIFAADPAVENRAQVNGYSMLDGGFKPNAATLFVTLKPFDDRYGSIAKAVKQNARAVLLGAYAKSHAIKDGVMLPVAPPPIPGLGSVGGFEFWIQDAGAGEPAQLEQVLQQFLAAARKRPELATLNATFNAHSQQLKIALDREKAQRLGVQVQDVYGTLQAQFGSTVASQFNQYSRTWNVVLQAEPALRARPEDLSNLYVRSRQGAMVPLSTLVTARYVNGPDLLSHFNGLPAAKINGVAAPAYSSGQAIAAMEEVAATLPTGYRFAWAGTAYEEKKSGSSSTVAFVFGLIVIFFILAAQFESWILPASVMTAVPFGVLGALLANWGRGLSNDVYFQIGLLVLIGLGAKNAILRVGFAVELRKEGLSALEASVKAGELRLRPIIMTSMAFIFGVLPLAIALGAGANSRHSIGTGIIGGMLGETTLAMVYVPLFYYLLDKLWPYRATAQATEEIHHD